ncbi:MAG TPA: 50S ribosomal protein L15 [Candidatus Dojkabacteria bacterium]|nr:50S ribosomal protein L15 [Candidatus Dojkabacteria bacterium]
MLHSLKKYHKKEGKRRGRGTASGKGGHTVGRGTKGHKSRSGFQQPRPGFEGGQMPLSRRLPKLKGFSRAYFKNKKPVRIVSLAKVAGYFKENAVIDANALFKAGFVRKSQNRLKILSDGKITKKLNFKQLEVSQTARKQIEAVKGTVK